MIREAIRARTLFNAFIGTSDTPKLLKLTLMHPLLVTGDVKTPSAWLPGYGKSTADCYFGITGDFFINDTRVFARASLEY